MGVKLVSSSGGSVELVAPTTASNFTMTVPANSGTVITTASTFAGTGPAFSAYNSATQTISSSTWSKVRFDVELFDTNSNFDTTNYRFLPTVAGYYQLNTTVQASGASTRLFVAIYKNGVIYMNGTDAQAASGNGVGSCVMYLNGSTDYAEIYIYTNATQVLGSGSYATQFSGAMVRAA